MSETELTSQAREVLDAARAVPCAPDAAAIERMNKAVLLATGAIGAAGVASAAGATAGKAGLSALAVKLIIVSSVAVLVVGGGVALSLSLGERAGVREKPTQQQVEAPRVVAPPTEAMTPSPAPAGEGRGEGEQLDVAPPPVEPKPTVTSKPPPTPVVVAKQEEPPPPPAPSEPTPNEVYARELALLEKARAQLQAREWSAVLTSISTHDSEFPNGKLGAEAEVLRILSLCEVNRVSEALERSKQLQRSAGRSPALLRLAGSCVEP